MNVRKNLFLLLFLFSFVLSGSDDLLEEYTVQLSRVADNYENAIRAANSRFGQDYQRTMQKFITVSRSLQKQAALCGADYHFDELAGNIQQMFLRTEKFFAYDKDGGRRAALGNKPFDTKKVKNIYERERERERKRSSGKKYKNRAAKERGEFLRENNPVPLFNILKNDLKNLQKGEFPAERSSAGNFRRMINEYRRLTEFYQKNYHNYLFRINSKPFRDEFRRRGELFLRSSQNLMTHVSRQSKGELSCNLAQETAIILRATGFYTAALDKEEKKGKKLFSAHNRQEVRYSFNKINKTIALLSKEYNVGTAQKVAKKLEKSRKSEENMEGMTEAALRQKLLQKRRKIFQGNTLMSGVDRTTLRKFRMTLTKQEQADFRKIHKNFTANGYDQESADRSSCVHILSQPKDKYDKKELVQILTKLENALEKEAERALND